MPSLIALLSAVLAVIFSNVCRPFSLFAMRSMSSIHRRHPILVLLPGIFIPIFLLFFFSLAISSIIVAYCSIDGTPSFMLSSILIYLVIPSLFCFCNGQGLRGHHQ